MSISRYNTGCLSNWLSVYDERRIIRSWLVTLDLCIIRIPIIKLQLLLIINHSYARKLHTNKIFEKRNLRFYERSKIRSNSSMQLSEMTEKLTSANKIKIDLAFRYPAYVAIPGKRRRRGGGGGGGWRGRQGEKRRRYS